VLLGHAERGDGVAAFREVHAGFPRRRV
jgi:hypothetical protein